MALGYGNAQHFFKHKAWAQSCTGRSRSPCRARVCAPRIGTPSRNSTTSVLPTNPSRNGATSNRTVRTPSRTSACAMHFSCASRPSAVKRFSVRFAQYESKRIGARNTADAAGPRGQRSASGYITHPERKNRLPWITPLDKRPPTHRLSSVVCRRSGSFLNLLNGFAGGEIGAAPKGFAGAGAGFGPPLDHGFAASRTSRWLGLMGFNPFPLFET